MHWLDWTIVLLVTCIIIVVAYRTKKYTRSVAHYLAAERCAKRYIISISEGIAFCGAISVLGLFELFYKAGFPTIYWGLIFTVTGYVLILSGWVVYRFRQTRCLTLGQFFEKRYSKRFRIFATSICFASGIIGFGIFPGVGSRFFVYYFGLPTSLACGGLEVPTFAIIMVIVLTISVLFTIWGGQIAVIVADYLQGAFSNTVFLILSAWLLWKIDWSHFQTLLDMPPGKSLANPYDSSEVDHFDILYWIIAAIGLIYNWMGFQGAQAYNASAKTAHESRMGRIIGIYRGLGQSTFFLVAPLCAYIVLHNIDFSQTAEVVNGVLDTIGNEEERTQMITPMVLKYLLPIGMIGLFAAMMVAALISTHDTYLHSWASIFIQDVVLPLRKEHLAPRQHMLILRLAVVGVAIFAFFFSLFYNQVQHLMLYFSITSAIFLGGSGAAIIGGLYWGRGSTAGAYCAMIFGAAVAVTGILLNQFIEDFPLDGQRFYGLAIISAAVTYVVVSLMSRKKPVNMDRILHRRQYAVSTDAVDDKAENVNRFHRMVGITKEFSLSDRIIYYIVIFATVCFALVPIIGNLFHYFIGVEPKSWLIFFYICVWIIFSAGIVSTIWVTTGGAFDIKSLFKDVAIAKIDDLDDGSVPHSHIED